VAALAVLLHGGPANAQDGPIRIIVSLPAGGGVDTMARFLAQQLGPVLGRSVFVENRPGASGTIAAKAVINAPRAQTTLLAGGNQEITIAPHLINSPGYKPLESLQPLMQVGTVPSVLVAPPGADASEEALVRKLRSAAGVAIGTPGQGTPMHIALEDLATQAKGTLLHVPYKGAPDVLAGVLAGSTPYGAVGYPAARNLIESGKLVPVSVLANQPADLVPGVPAIGQKMQMKRSIAQVWYGFFAPAHTPPDERKRIESALATVMKEPAVRARLAEFGIQVTALPPDAFRRALQTESADFRQALTEHKIQ
jgi:tripartite-type tricarboxylate transporter receptor subunit TctC